MKSPLTALAWEIWHRGRRSIGLVLGCLALCALINLAIVARLPTESARANFAPFFGLLMVLSFLLLMGIFNYTEFNSTREWHGFPYRLFVLPIRTWKLVALPMLLGVVSVELVYFGWIKLVWSREQIIMPGWFAVVLGAYVVFYQTTLWSLAGLRITRMIALGVGGVSGIAVAWLPALGTQVPSPWLAEKRLILLVSGTALLAFLLAWASVCRQRGGGGRRHNRLKTLLDRIADAMPQRTQPFRSAPGAQFWFEWRHTGWLLPASTLLVLAIIGPLSAAYQTEAQFTVNTLIKLLAMPPVLAFAIGKGFIKPQFWSTDLSLPTFLAVKPLPSGDFVITKMKVAALSVALTWLFVLAFIALWLPLWANTANLKQLLFEFRMFYPRSWQTVAALYLAGFMVLSWRCLVSGLWVGLSGSRLYYVGSLALQVIVPSLVLLACGIWSDSIDEAIRTHPDRVKSVALAVIGWALALAVVFKVWLAVFSWQAITPIRTRQYLLLWSGATLGFVALAILSRPPFDFNRVEHLLVLGALLLCPFARLGLAPWSFTRNRHRLNPP
jgi:hypothetical protein